MKRLLERKALVLFIISVIFMMSAVFAFSCRRNVTPPTQGLETNSTAPVLTSPPSTTTTSTTASTTTTTTETTTTETTTTEAEIQHHFSHMIVFLDIQRAVFFHTPENGDPIAEVSLRISTGAGNLKTPTTPADKPHILSGYTARLLLFTKSRPIVWVRYATHVSGDIFFHSQPYDHFVDPDGKDVPLDKSLFNLAGYRSLGNNTISHGCIRLAMRDAIYLANTIYKGMPVYVFQSSKGYDIPAAESLPPVDLNTRWDPTDMDPANPYRQREKNNMAWRYKPTGAQPMTPAGKLPAAADCIGNKDQLPAGTSYRYLYTPDVSAPVLRTVFIVVTYPDGSYEEVRTKINVVTEEEMTATTPTTTPETTSPESSETEPPTTTETTTVPEETSPPATTEADETEAVTDP